MHCLQNGLYFKDLVLNKDLFGILGPYRVLIYISGSLFSLFWFLSRKECQFSLHVYNNEDSLHCWQILIFTYAYTLIFIHRRLGPYFGCWGSFLGPHFTKNWVLIGSLSQSLGVFISFGGSEYGECAFCR